MRFRFFLVSGAALLLISSQIIAKGPGAGHCYAKKGDKIHRMWQELGLTEQQQTEIKQLHEEMKKTRKNHWKNVRGVRKQIREELKKENPDRIVLDQHAEKMGELAKQIAQKRSNHLLQIKDILTDEQFQKMVEQKESHKHNRRGRKHKNCSKEGSIQ